MVEITMSDFATGIIAGLSAEGRRSIHYNGIEEKILAGFNWLHGEASRRGFEIAFHISPNRFHDGSVGAKQILRDAHQADLFYYDGNIIRSNITKNFAYRYLEELPGGEEMWRTVAKHMVISEFSS